MTNLRFSLALALLLALTGISTVALGQERVSKEFTKRYEAGVDAFNLGKYAEARGHFEKARTLEPKLPGPYRYLAAVAQREERWEDCLGLAAEAVKLNPKSNQFENTQQIHEGCRQGLGRAPREVELGSGGAIAVVANVDGATIRLNGLRYGATPMAPRAFAAGEVEIAVEAKGYLPQTRNVEIIVGLVTDVVFDLGVDPTAVKTEEINPKATEDVKFGWVKFTVAAGLEAKVVVDGQLSSTDDKGFHSSTPGLKTVEISVVGAETWRRRVRFVRGQRRVIEVAVVSSDERAAARKRGYYGLAGAAVFGLAGASFSILESRAYYDARSIANTESARPTTVSPEISSAIAEVRTRADLADAETRSKRYAVLATVAYGAAAASLGVAVYYFLKERPVEVPNAPPPVAITPLLNESDRGLGFVVSSAVSW